jgi:hypothetical protein
MSRIPFRSSRLSAATAALLLALPGSLHAEAVEPATIRIHPSSLSPARAVVDGERSFVIANRSPDLARVEFQLPRGEGVFCHGSGATPRSARRFLVDGGSRLVCVVEPGRYRYRVYQSVPVDSGGFVHREHPGRIDVR